MDEDRQVRPGFLPPRAPGVPAAPQPPVQPAPERPLFVSQRMESGPRSPVALAGTVIGSIAIVLLLLSAGFAFLFTGFLSSVGVMLGVLAKQQIAERGVGRAGQARAAIWVGAIGIGLALVAWIVLEATGFTQEELQRRLEDLQKRLEEERARSRG